MDSDTFYDKFYAGTQVPRDIVLRLRPIYCDFFYFDPPKLRPSDRPPIMDDLDTSQLVEKIEKAFSIAIPPQDSECLDGSFDSIARYLARRIAADKPTASTGASLADQFAFSHYPRPLALSPARPPVLG